MSLHRRAAKRDSAEPAIVSALEALSCVVWRMSGTGLPDLIVLRAGKKWLADVKGPKEKPTPAQVASWTVALAFARCAVFILRTPEDAAAMLNDALQPWEPTVKGSIRALGKGRKRLADLKGKERLMEVSRRLKAGEPVYGDAATARTKECWCAAGLPCRHDTPANNQRLANAINAYTPPRSKPVDAAKEAEATFAATESCCAEYEGFGYHGTACEHYEG